jgi:hypothetical protein
MWTGNLENAKALHAPFIGDAEAETPLTPATTNYQLMPPQPPCSLDTSIQHYHGTEHDHDQIYSESRGSRANDFPSQAKHLMATKEGSRGSVKGMVVHDFLILLPRRTPFSS